MPDQEQPPTQRIVPRLAHALQITALNGFSSRSRGSDQQVDGGPEAFVRAFIAPFHFRYLVIQLFAQVAHCPAKSIDQHKAEQSTFGYHAWNHMPSRQAPFTSEMAERLNLRFNFLIRRSFTPRNSTPQPPSYFFQMAECDFEICSGFHAWIFVIQGRDSRP